MLKCQKKWLELFLKKFLLCTFRNNVESETVLYLTNGRKRGPIRSSLDVSFSSPTTVDKEPKRWNTKSDSTITLKIMKNL